jgi:hypothetical protein
MLEYAGFLDGPQLNDQVAAAPHVGFGSFILLSAA